MILNSIKLFLVIITGTFLTACSPFVKEKASLEYGKTITIQGEVSENNFGCTADLACYLLVKTKQGLVRVDYSISRKQCNQKAAKLGMEIEKGDKVKAFGIVTEDYILSTCDADNYYLQKL